IIKTPIFQLRLYWAVNRPLECCNGRPGQSSNPPQARGASGGCRSGCRQSRRAWTFEGRAKAGEGQRCQSRSRPRRTPPATEGRVMKSPVVKRSIVIAGHKTSVSLEDAFWQGLKQIAQERGLTLSDLVATIDTDRRQGNLSSAIR